MKDLVRTAMPAILILGMIGCASARLEIVRPLPAPEQRVVLRLEGAPESRMTEEQRGRYQSLLTSRLSEKGITVVAAQPDAHAAKGTVTKYDPGSRALRYLIGFGAGRGSLETRWDVLDQAGGVAGACRITGSVVMGVFGGSFDDVLEKSADRLGAFLKGETK